MESGTPLNATSTCAPRRKRQSRRPGERASLGQLQLRILKDAGSHLRHRVEQAARLQRLASTASVEPSISRRTNRPMRNSSARQSGPTDPAIELDEKG